MDISFTVVHTFTEENYLKTIFSLSTATHEWVSTNALADSTQTRAASVSDMIKRLAEKKLIHYQKYNGVKLTNEGERVALGVIRKHRLWEVFLVDKLHFSWDEVHPIAEELEHIRSEKLIENLNIFLENPQFDPHGDPIPNADGAMPQFRYLQLCDIAVNQSVIMMGVSEHSASFLQHLQKMGLLLGAELTITEINAYDKSLVLTINQQNQAFMSYEVAKHILVK